MKTTINSSANFSLPPVSSFYAFNADNALAPCQCSIGDVVVNGSAISDAEIRGLAGGARPPLSPDPLLYWPLSATAPIEPDVSGNNHPGAVIGSIGAVAGPPYAVPESRVTAPNAASNSMIENVSYGPLASSNGPFTIAFWFQSGNVNPEATSYVMEGFMAAANGLSSTDTRLNRLSSTTAIPLCARTPESLSAIQSGITSPTVRASLAVLHGINSWTESKPKSAPVHQLHFATGIKFLCPERR